MSKKKLIISILLLVIGSAIIPGGIFANKYINDLVSDNVHTGLIGIQEEASPIVERLVNITFAAYQIFLATLGNAEDFFNNETYHCTVLFGGDLVVDQDGISLYTGLGNLSYTKLAQNRLLWGNSNRSQVDYIPGFNTEPSLGGDAAWGAIDFIDDYSVALNDPIKRITMQSNYNCTWEQLTYIANYVEDYLIPDRVPWVLSEGNHLLIKPELAVVDNTTKAIAYLFFLTQWANGSLVPSPGFPMPLGFMELYGFEVGIPNPTNMSFKSACKLWNQSSEYSLLNKLGMMRWKEAIANPDSSIASYLQSVNDLEDKAMELILAWLPEFESNVMPYLAQYLYGLPTNTTELANALKIGGIIIGALMIGIAMVVFLKMRLPKKLKVNGSV